MHGFAVCSVETHAASCGTNVRRSSLHDVSCTKMWVVSSCRVVTEILAVVNWASAATYGIIGRRSVRMCDIIGRRSVCMCKI